MDEKLSKEVIDRMARELRLIHEYVENLVVDDIDNEIRNAERCLREEGRTLEIENIAKNRMYHAGENSVINDIRDIIGLDRLYLKGEKERIDESIKLGSMGTRLGYDCPPLEESDYTLSDGNAKLIVLGEEQDTYVVIGTKSASKAYKLMRKYERDECGLGIAEGIAYLYSSDNDSIPREKIVWRKAEGEYEGEFGNMFSWSETNIKGNPRAVDAFLVRVG